MIKYHARGTHTHKIRRLSFGLLTLAIICAVIFGIAFSGVYGNVAYAAASDVRNGTYLGSTTGLDLGANDIRTSSINNNAEYVSGDSLSDNRFGNDFYFELTTSDWDYSTSASNTPNRVGYGDDGMYLNYYTNDTQSMPNAKSFSFNSKILLTDNNLAAAMRGDGRVDVTISFEYQYYNKDKDKSGEETVADQYDDIFDIECSWAPNGVVTTSKLIAGNFEEKTNVISSTKKRAEATLTLDKSNFDVSTAYLSIEIGNFQTEGADVVQDGSDTKFSTGIFVKISTVTVSVVNATDYSMEFDSTGVRVVESSIAKSRDDANVIYTSNDKVYFESNEITSSSTDYSLKNDAVYVKMGDMIYLYSDVFMTIPGEDTVRMPLSEDYSASVNMPGQKAIQWVNTLDSYYYGFNHYITLQDYSNTTDQASGRTTIYKVDYQQSGEETETMIEVRPKIVASYIENPELPGTYIYDEVTVDSSQYTKIYFDNNKPATPEISDDSILGQYGYNTADFGDIEEQNIEKRYTDGLKISFTLKDKDKFNFATGTKKAPESIYYTINGESPQDASSTRYKASLDALGSAEIDLNKPTNNPLNPGGIGNGSGFYEIKLVAIDAAGNYSDVVTYKIVVDNTDYEVNTYFLAGTSNEAKNKNLTPNSPQTASMATISMSNPNNKNTLEKEDSRTYKRGSNVAIRIEMTEAQKDGFQLVSISNGGRGASLLSWSKDDIVFTKESNRYVYTINVQLDKYIEPNEHNLGFTVKSTTQNFYVYNGFAYSEGAKGNVSENNKIGTYDQEKGVINLNLGSYSSSPIMYKVILTGTDKGIYLMTEAGDGDFAYNSKTYLTSLVKGMLITLDGKTVDLIGSTLNARNFYFTFKQIVEVTESNQVSTFSFDEPTETVEAIAHIQDINLNPDSAYSILKEETESFAGLKDEFDIKYYKLVSSTYRTIAELQSAIPTLEEAIASGHVELYTEGAVAHSPRYAGEYWYVATISTMSTFYDNYYFYKEGSFIIKKASPQTLNVAFAEENDQGVLVAKTLVYASGGMAAMDAYIYGTDHSNSNSKTFSSIGVMGEYHISQDTPEYLNPKVGVHYVNVIFTPAAVNSNDKYAILNSSNIETTNSQRRLEVVKANVAIKVDESSLTKTYNKANQVVDITVKLHDDLSYMPMSKIPNATGSTMVVNSNLTIDTSDLQVKYEFRTDLNADFTSSVPILAGVYDVKVIVTGANYYGEVIISNRYFSSSDRVSGIMDGEYTINGQKADVKADNTNVTKTLNGFIIDEVQYFIVGNRIVSYASDKQNIAIGTNADIYTVAVDGSVLQYALHNGQFYALTAISAIKSVEVYEEHSNYYYRNLFTIDNVRYYYDTTGVYASAIFEDVNKVGTVDGRMLTINGITYYISNDNALYKTTLAVKMQDVGEYINGNFTIGTTNYYVDVTAEKIYTVSGETQLEINPTLIYQYNGDFTFDDEFYTVVNNNIFNRMAFVIEKKELVIVTGFSEEYDYTYYKLPIANSQMYAYSMVLADDGQMRPERQNVEFSVTYTYSITIDGEYKEVLESDTSKFNAGYYKAKVIITAANYQGYIEDEFKINRVTRGYVSSGILNINQPEVLTPEGLGNANAAYGQTIGDLLLSTGNNVNVKYLTQSGTWITVGLSSNYRPALRQNAIDPTMDDYDYYGIDVVGTKTYNDTVFDSVGIDPNGYYIIFIPNDLVNFAPFAVTIIVNVAQATPLYSGDTDVENNYDAKFIKQGTADEFLTYGDKFSLAILTAGGQSVSNNRGSLFFYYGTEKRQINGIFTTATSQSTVFAAGEHIITYNFTPNDSQFKSISFDVTLTVDKKELQVIYTDSQYTLPYGGTIDILKGISNSTNTIVMGYQYTVYRDSEMSEELIYTTKFPAGDDYYIKVSVTDDNYSGWLLMPFIVEKATPNVIAAPVVNGFEWDMLLKELDVNNGSARVINSLSNEVITGTFSIDYTNAMYTQDTSFEEEFALNNAATYAYSIKLLFTPAADFGSDYSPVIIDWTLNVQKVTLTASDFRFDTTPKVYTAAPLYPTVYATIDGVEIEYSDQVEYDEEPIISGSYNLTLKVKDSNPLYRGSTATTFIIAKRNASDVVIVPNAMYIEEGESLPTSPWLGMEITPESIYTLQCSALTAGAPIYHSIRVSRGNSNNVEIQAVGRYTLTLTFNGNFEGEKSFDFVVRYKEVNYLDAVDGVITKTYTADSTQTGKVTVSAITPSTLSYKIQYAKYNGLTLGEYGEDVPYQAGRYHARLHFEKESNMGYDGFDKGVDIIINPATTTITVTKLKDFVYTGQGLDAALYLNKCFEVIASHASISQYNYQYSSDGDNWTNTPYANAGDYFIKITPKNSNFTGEVIYPYTIVKGDLTYLGLTDSDAKQVETIKMFYSAYKKGENDNAYFTLDSLDAFTFASQVIEGYFIIKERDSLDTLYKGEYTNYEYVFTPTGDNAKNINPYEGTVTITIDKLDISQYLTFEESTLTQKYTGSELVAKVRFKTEAELVDIPSLHLSSIVKNSIIDSINVRYGNSNSPTNAGSYALTTTSTHDNYFVSITADMQIEKASPEIVKPDYFNLVSNDMFDTANNDALNELKTLYALNGNVAVAGHFDIVELKQGETYIVTIKYTPDDSIDENVTEVFADLRIVYFDSTPYINEADIVIEEVTSYGRLLQDVAVSLSGGQEYQSIGAFTWQNGDIITPSVGETEYTLVFTPHITNQQHYSIQTFQKTVTVTNKKTIATEDIGNIYWDVKVGEKFEDGTAVILDGLYKDLQGFTLDSLTYTAGTVGIGDTVTADMFKNGRFNAILTFVSNDYTISGEITAKVNLYLLEDAFNISGTTAEYAGNSLTKDMLYGSSNSIIKLTVTDAGLLPKCNLTIFDDMGNEIDAISKIGTYKIRIEIDRSYSNYAGYTEVIFTMTAEDLSQYILLNGESAGVTEIEDGYVFSKVYASSLSLIPSLNKDAIAKEISDDDYELLRYYKKAGDDDSKYSLYNTPFDAGEYYVKVVLTNSDYYRGEKVFKYNITKKSVSISINGFDLVSGGGYILNAKYGSVSIPTLALGEGVKNYTIVYSDGNTTYTTTPQNAGEYTATVIVIDNNYQGTATFNLSIAKEEARVNKKPTLSSIYYGTLTRNAVMSNDWTASTDGYIEFVDGDSILNAGENSVQLRFVPNNENYATVIFEVPLTVIPAVATVTFNTTELVYTGERIAVSYNKLSFVDDAQIVFTFYTLSGASLLSVDPITAGTYYVRVVAGSMSGNYYYTNVEDTQLTDYTKYQKIIIKKAEAVGYVSGKEPTATSVEYGYPIDGYSMISSDTALYDDGKGGEIEVKGTYTFKNGLSPQFTVGTIYADIVFTPDNKNYEVLYDKIAVKIVKAKVQIEVTSGTKITYGTQIKGATAIEAAKNFKYTVDNDSQLINSLQLDSYTMDNYVNTVLDSGSYNFKVVLEHENYTGELVFAVTVQKKAISLIFFADSQLTEAIDMATGYNFTYLTDAKVYAGVSTDLTDFASTLVSDPTDTAAVSAKVAEIREEINGKIVFSYIEESTGKTYSNIASILKAAGTYRVVAEVMTSLNFVAEVLTNLNHKTTAWTYINVGKAQIGKIDLDSNTLRQQTYGNVAAPVVYIYNADSENPVRLTNVQYHINWGDSQTMPISAGDHPATIIIDDPNYVYTEKNIVFTIKKKAITLINLSVKDKVYDGTPWLEITADISGAILGDELGLNISAHTANKATNAGRHNVQIYSCSLYGLAKDNYYIVTPTYNGVIDIYNNVIYTENQDSYVLFNQNVDGKYTFNVQEIESKYNKTGFFSTIVGQSAQVVSFSIREDGLKVELDEPVQVYIKVPERYKDRVDLEYYFVGGGASNDDIVFNREGDYISFYTTVSGEIVFETSAFPYGTIFIATGLVLLIGGAIFIFLLDPAKKKVGFSGIRRKTPTDEAYRKLTQQKIIRDNTPPQYDYGKKNKKDKKK